MSATVIICEYIVHLCHLYNVVVFQLATNDTQIDEQSTATTTQN